MKPPKQYCVALGMLLLATNAFAAELLPVMNDNQLGLTLTDVAWPATLAKDFSSGIENRILILVLAVSNGKPITQTEVVIVEKYDLWNELFSIKILVDGTTRKKNTFSRVEDSIAYLTTLNITEVFPLNKLQQSQLLSLQTDILINPVERQKIESVTRWVAENSVSHVPGGAARLTSKPNSLFNTIYEQYIHGADIAAPWKMSVLSHPFKLQNLQTEPHNSESK